MTVEDVSSLRTVTLADGRGDSFISENFLDTNSESLACSHIPRDGNEHHQTLFIHWH
jgi:hypothetical protein